MKIEKDTCMAAQPGGSAEKLTGPLGVMNHRTNCKEAIKAHHLFLLWSFHSEFIQNNRDTADISRQISQKENCFSNRMYWYHPQLLFDIMQC